MTDGFPAGHLSGPVRKGSEKVAHGTLPDADNGPAAPQLARGKAVRAKDELPKKRARFLAPGDYV